ncbi:MAG: hypothetical protein SF028_01085 [Candidatus Sumerlaeia bacterium]|nr:hypothetical protein [Candidatus Sumerlaeia bacterium]
MKHTLAHLIRLAGLMVFLLVLALPMGDHLFSLDRTTPINEKRELAPRPTRPPSLESLDKTFKSIDAYVNDRFGFRDWAIKKYYLWKIMYLKVSPQKSAPSVTDQASGIGYPEVIVGKDGFLFFGKDKEPENFRGLLQPFSDTELAAYRKEVATRATFLKQMGNIPYIYVLIPNKSTAYPDKMPSTYTRLDTPRRYDQIVSALQGIDNLYLVDLRPFLEQRRRDGVELVYHKTDTHWTFESAFMGFREIAKVINARFPEFEVPSQENYESREIKWATDLAVYIGLQTWELDRDSPLFEPVFELTPKAGLLSRQVHPVEWPARDKYAISFGSFRSPRSKAPSVLMFSDSFGIHLWPLFREASSAFEYYRTTEFLATPIKSFQPNVVVQLTVERFAIVGVPAPMVE